MNKLRDQWISSAKSFRCTQILLCTLVVVFSSIAEPTEFKIQFGLQGDVVLRLPESAQTRLKWLNVGMTREQVDVHFDSDGGIFVPFHQRYCVRGVTVDSKNVMVELSFRPAGMSDAIYADEKLRRNWLRDRPHYLWDNPRDVLQKIGLPFLQHRAID